MAEFLTTEGLQQGYGGGFDLAYPNQGRIGKVEDMLYAIWFVHGTESFLNELSSGKDISFSRPPVFIRTLYVGDVLLILRATIFRNVYMKTRRDFGRANFIAMVAYPPFIGGEAGTMIFDEDKVNSRSSWACSAFVFEENYSHLIFIDEADRDESLMEARFDFKKRQFYFGSSKEYWERVANNISIRSSRFASWL